MFKSLFFLILIIFLLGCVNDSQDSGFNALNSNNPSVENNEFN